MAGFAGSASWRHRHPRRILHGMKRFALALLLSILTTAASGAVFEGHLLPSKCRDANPVEHTKACALACRTSGFGLLTGGEFVPFDPAGSKKALALLEATSKTADLRARVEGTKERGMLVVDKIALLGAAPAASTAPARTDAPVSATTDPRASATPAAPVSASTSAPASAGTVAPIPAGPRTVAILLFDGVQTIDFSGPYEVLADAIAGGGSAFRVVTVAEEPGVVRTVNGLTVTPDFTFANAPHADVVVIPGGSVLPILDHPAVVDWVRRTAADATIVLGVCNGSFFLARAGLLDGLEVTTTAGNLAALKALAPKAIVTGHKRVTDNGKIITTGGLAAGIDGALHVVQRLTGEPLARGLALVLEYNWQTEGSFLPGTLAFRHLMPLVVSTVLPLDAELVSSEGDAKHWVIGAKLETLRTPAQVAAMFRESATATPGWTEVARGRTETAACYAFADYDDTKWKSCYELAPATGGGMSITLVASTEGVAVAPAVAREKRAR
jgi:putative intracellular protease/amidase